MADGKGESPGLKATLIIGNIFIMLCGITLFAETVWVVTDGYKVYPLTAVSGKDDIFAGAWIAIFTGFAFFCTSVYGIISVARESRSMLMLYLVLMLIIYIFESASCITSFTNRDYMVGNSNLIKKQMLQYYTDASNPGQLVTSTWNRIMLGQQCCGADSPLDWVTYNSTFSVINSNGNTFPLNCCARQTNYLVANLNACNAGDMNYINANGCFPYIQFALDRYTWGVSWFGFAILMFTLPVMLLAMVFYVRL
ncbi:uroplakin-1a-like [Erpetoichthys calabaricus]|uniref:Tetraspanin n=1 Tax=Erpetoichthys calabaricus TaxID=27687 RepID=A0A8C4T2Z3_ERPCA|nr:uroplakin-1a-like [Erpetoichthys calabaricus]